MKRGRGFVLGFLVGKKMDRVTTPSPRYLAHTLRPLRGPPFQSTLYLLRFASNRALAHRTHLFNHDIL